MLVLDIGLPDGSGLDLCREVRALRGHAGSLPVLMLSAHGEELDRVLGLELGADSDSTDRTVDTHIKTLRIKLQQAAPGSNFIMTHRGMGYSAEV